jgi:hypothetical protein
MIEWLDVIYHLPLIINNSNYFTSVAMAMAIVAMVLAIPSHFPV